MIRNYLKIAWRNIWKNRSTSLLNIGGLAIAVAVATYMLVWVQNELRFDKHHPEANRIHLLTQYDTSKGNYLTEQSPFIAYEAIQQEIPEADLVAAARPLFTGVILSTGNLSQKESSVLVIDSNWTKMFHYAIEEGSIANNNTDKLIISRRIANKYFGNNAATGQVMFVDSIPYSVGAVVSNPLVYSSFQQDILIPNTHLSRNKNYARSLDYWGSYSQYLFIKINAKNKISQAEQKITNLFWQHQTWKKDHINHSKLFPLADIHFSNQLKSEIIEQTNYRNIYIYSLMALLLLATACANFVNISVAQTGNRLKEIGVRKIIGAAKKQLFTQAITETILNIFIAVGIALGLILIALPAFNELTEKAFTISHFASIPVVLLLSGIFLLVLLLTGLYPAILMATLQPLSLLKKKSLGSLSGQSLQKILVTGQFVFVLITLWAVFIIQKQFRFIQEQTADYQKEQVFSFVTPPPKEPIKMSDNAAVEGHRQQLYTVKTELLKSTAIEGVSKVNGISILDDNQSDLSEIRWADYPKSEEVNVVNMWVDEDYLKVANLTMIAGRWFDGTNQGDQRNIILNETAVKAYELKEPVIGRSFTNGINGDGVVIGIVKDFHHKSLHEKIDPVVFSIDPFMGAKYFVRAHKLSIQQSLADAKSVWDKHYPEKEFEYHFLDESFARTYKEDMLAYTFSKILGLLCILLSCIGLIGMITISAQQRSKEVGIRKVLGASVSSITALLSKAFLKLVILAIIIALPVAWWSMNSWLSNFAYRIEIRWWMYLMLGIGVIIIALITMSYQAIKAAIANPVKSLRDE